MTFNLETVFLLLVENIKNRHIFNQSRQFFPQTQRTTVYEEILKYHTQCGQVQGASLFSMSSLLLQCKLFPLQDVSR